MLRGKRLQKGDTIGIVAPAGIAAPDKINAAVLGLVQMGYNVKTGDGCRRHWYGYAGNDQMRAQEINNFFLDDEVDAILCLRGGYGSIRLLSQIDYNAVRCHPKIFMGFSDITALHVVMNQISELITFHGPMLASNFADIDEETAASFERAVGAGINPIEITNPKGHPLKALSPGIAEGVLIGGNLTTLVSLLGTAYAPDFTDKILFIEEIDEAAYRIDRMLTQLRLAGAFRQMKGIILGDFNGCTASSSTDMSLTEVFHDHLAGLAIPVISNFKSGHCRPIMTLPLGVRAKIDGNHATIALLEPVVANGE